MKRQYTSPVVPDLPLLWTVRTLGSRVGNYSGCLVRRRPDTSKATNGHRQLVGLRARWRATRTACPWLRRSGEAGDLGPNLEGLGPGGSILRGGHSVTAEVEEVVDPVVGGQEALRLAG